MFLFIMTGPPHAAQASFKFAILLSQLPKCWDCRCTLLKSRWWASLRLCHKQRTALALVSNPKLKSIWIKSAKSNWPVQFQSSLVLKNTFVSGSKRRETTQALRSRRPSQVGPSRLTLPVQAVTLGNSTHCQCVHMWPRVNLWESQVLRGSCRDLVGRRGSLFNGLIQLKWNFF